jgi:fumarate hydratase subunit alpha
MRKINVKQIRDAVKELCVSSNTVLRKDVHDALKKAFRKETNKRAKGILDLLLENADLARKNGLAVCQDTGLVVVHLDVGQDVRLSGGDIKKAVNDGVLAGYGQGHFRKSSVKDPVTRTGA